MRRPNRSRYERRRSLFQVQRIISESCEDGSAETFLTLVGKRWTRRLDVNRCELDVNHISPPVSLLPANPFIMFIPMFIQKPWNAVKCRVLYLGNQTLCVCVYCTIHCSQEGVQGCSEQQRWDQLWGPISKDRPRFRRLRCGWQRQ